MDATLKDNPLAILNRILFTHDLDFQVCEPAKVVKVYNDGTALVQPLTKLVADNKTNGTLTEKRSLPFASRSATRTTAGSMSNIRSWKVRLDGYSQQTETHH